MAYGDFKDLNRRTFVDKVFCDKAFDFKDPKLMNIKEVLLQWFIKFLIKKLLVVALQMKIMKICKWKPIIGKFDKRKVHSPFIDNICGADLAINK